jgi:flagellar hook-associated protein 2
MAGLQLSGLASGLDWKSLVDSLISLERTPANRLAAEKVANNTRITALNNLGSRLNELRTASAALNTSGLFTGRTATFASTGSSWSATAAAGATTGTFTFAVTQLATAAKRTGSADIGQGISATNDVSGVTLSTLGTGRPVTAGQFSINGARITVDPTESLQDLFDRISQGTDGAVTASYDAASDRIQLSSDGPITLGAANDTSNFLSVARLHNNGTGSITSAAPLGTVNISATLTQARLRTDVTAVDAEGKGSFTINGVAIEYNVNNDSLSAVLARINASSAGVSAGFDPATDRVVLTNKATGDLGITVSEDAGGLLGALGITTGGTHSSGRNAEFSLNGGDTIVSTSNSLSEDAHGITGLIVNATSEGSQTITVGSDTAKMKTAIETFISKFNAVQQYIDEQTRVTSANGKVTAGTLSNNREIQQWSQAFRSAAFAVVGGLSGTIARLEHLGIDFTAGSAELSIKDQTKFDAALKNAPNDVEAFFRTASTGFAARFDRLFGSFTGPDGNGGLMKSQRESLTKANESIDRQIEEIDRRLVGRRAQMEAAFIAMEQAQAKIQQMQTQLTNSFFRDQPKR